VSAARRGGLVLLEVLVALIVLSLVALGALRLAHEGGALVTNAREWSTAVSYAEDGMELLKLGSSAVHGPPGDILAGGFRRQVARRPAGSDVSFELVTVTVFLPGGGRFDVERLAHLTPEGDEQW
jgi:Tfp pilus assembly protein PilV